ncbi:MAG: SIS domain-containing protein [Clostridia bacterium]|nr:SIS domain-containing protein [Clostridia bacterium]
MLKTTTLELIKDLIKRYPDLTDTEADITSAVEVLIKCFKKGGKLLVCGNGGSASDALHIVGELMKDFYFPRPLTDDEKLFIHMSGEDGEYICENLQRALPCIALVGSPAIESAYANDRAPDLCFAQQVFGLGSKGDVLLGISTSGNSKNVIYASQVAKSKGMTVIGLTGKTGGKMNDKCDICLKAPEIETYKIQERHLPMYHTICLCLENEFFGK